MAYLANDVDGCMTSKYKQRKVIKVSVQIIMTLSNGNWFWMHVLINCIFILFFAGVTVEGFGQLNCYDSAFEYAFSDFKIFNLREQESIWPDLSLNSHEYKHAFSFLQSIDVGVVFWFTSLKRSRIQLFISKTWPNVLISGHQ